MDFSLEQIILYCFKGDLILQVMGQRFSVLKQFMLSGKDYCRSGMITFWIDSVNAKSFEEIWAQQFMWER